jgi:hypothetical protein
MMAYVLMTLDSNEIHLQGVIRVRRILDGPGANRLELCITSVLGAKCVVECDDAETNEILGLGRSDPAAEGLTN